MATFMYKTKGNADPKGKPRVYFTCHPSDFEVYFEKIKADVFATHDVALYYTPDMREGFDPEYIDTDLGQMNLFVVPVTGSLLIQPNRAMDEDILYAKQKNIPILPFMMEQELDTIYSRPEKFGERQYITPFSTDLTEIRYEEKLKRYLESVLISDKMSKRIRKAFDAYIFLSYRKKDRKYANELMKLIHKNPELEDIAIWYDEFLTPGESFADNIKKALNDSKLFALLVTPSLLEEPDGQPNFVMAMEYPAAQQAQKLVIPAEMVPTDHDALADKFPSIPDCSDPQDDIAFRERLLQSLQKLAITANDHDPEHNFLIGLAYLDGIDVEVNRERGLKLITSAAEMGLIEAMEKAKSLYYNGIDGNRGYQEAVKWAERVYTYYSEKYGMESPDALCSLSDLAYAYRNIKNRGKEIELREQLCERIARVFGEEHPKHLEQMKILCNIVDQQKAVKIRERLYELHIKIYGATHLDTMTALSRLASAYGRINDHQRSRDCHERLYAIKLEQYGEYHDDTLDELRNVMVACSLNGEKERRLELAKKLYHMRCKVYGEESYHTLNAMGDLASAYGNLGDHKKAIELREALLTIKAKQDVHERLDDSFDLLLLAGSYNRIGDYEKAIDLLELRQKRLIRKHGETALPSLTNMGILVNVYMNAGEYQKALEYGHEAYALHCHAKGEQHRSTLDALRLLALAYSKLDNYEKALEHYEKLYELQCNVLGEEHADTLRTKGELQRLIGQN